MRKLFLLLILISTATFSQSFGDYTIDNYTKASQTNDLKGKWIELKEDSFFKRFNETTIGVKNAIEECKHILAINGLDFSKPDKDNSYLNSLVKSYSDYEMLHTTLYLEKSEVIRSWEIEDVTFSLLLNKNLYMIAINKFPKK